MKTRFYQMMAVCALCLAVAALAVALWTSVLAQEGSPEAATYIPPTINYQGFLREPDGSLTTGTHDITANIYNLATGGEALYSTTLSDVTVRDGLFNIVLGDNPELDKSVFANSPLYIGISIDGATELIPRQRLHAVPWAFQASTLINNAIPQTVQGLTSNGDVAVTGNTTMNGSATVGGDLTVTGNLAHPDEKWIGPHFIWKKQVIEWGPCYNTPNWVTFDVTDKVPPGATAVILEYKVKDSLATDSHIYIRKGEGEEKYILAYIRAATIYDDAGWGGQGTYPVNDTGTKRTFQYQIINNIQQCEIWLAGYYK